MLGFAIDGCNARATAAAAVVGETVHDCMTDAESRSSVSDAH